MEITVNTYDEFEKLTQAKDIRIAEALYDAIISNLKTKKRSIYFLSVHILEDEKIVDLTVERPYFSDTLEELLPTFIEYEKYEECKIIKETIEKLKK
jgi:flagellar biosynthesis regulator FlbT